MTDYPYLMKVKTRRPIGRLERWLYDQCRAGWSLSLAGLEDDEQGNRVKIVTIAFEQSDDRARFKATRTRQPVAASAN